MLFVEFYCKLNHVQMNSCCKVRCGVSAELPCEVDIDICMCASIVARSRESIAVKQGPSRLRRSTVLTVLTVRTRTPG
jgi:hypothetical protein